MRYLGSSLVLCWITRPIGCYDMAMPRIATSQPHCVDHVAVCLLRQVYTIQSVFALNILTTPKCFICVQCVSGLGFHILLTGTGGGCPPRAVSTESFRDLDISDLKQFIFFYALPCILDASGCMDNERQQY